MKSEDTQKTVRIDSLALEAAYKNLRKRIIDEGLLDRRYVYYASFALFIYTGFFACFAGVYFAEDIPAVCALSMAFALFSVQIGGLIHDAGHRAIFKSAKANDIFGHISAVFLAACYNNWRINHNRHHALPNQISKDPDIEIPFCFTKQRFQKLSGFMAKIKRFQHYTYYPFGAFASLTMRFKRYDYFKENFSPAIYWEIALFVIGVLLRYILPLVLFGLEKGTLFLVCSTVLEGLYMFHVFAPNHKGLLELADDVKMPFLQQQVITSRNIKGSPLINFIFMGLNYQIEHHLFPNTPRFNLRRLTPSVMRCCQENRLRYFEVNLIQSNRMILSTLKDISSAG